MIYICNNDEGQKVASVPLWSRSLFWPSLILKPCTYQITQYKSNSDQGWANNCISIVITRAHKIEFVLASCQLWEDRWHLSQYKAWLIQINPSKLFEDISVIGISLYWIKALLHVTCNLMSCKAGFTGSLYYYPRFHLHSISRATVKKKTTSELRLRILDTGNPKQQMLTHRSTHKDIYYNKNEHFACLSHKECLLVPLYYKLYHMSIIFNKSNHRPA